MAIHKANVDTNYTVIPNETARDKQLSFEARGVLAMLLSLPSEWQVNNSWLQSQSSAGRDKVNSILKELISKGYMTREQPKTQKGKFSQNDYFVYASPVNGIAVNGSPVSGKTPTIKERSLEKKEVINIIGENEVDTVSLGFELFWAEMKLPKKAKPVALKSFNKAVSKIDDPVHFARRLVNDTLTRFNNKQFGFDKMHPSTYLNQCRWEDDYTIDKPTNQKVSMSGGGDWAKYGDETF